MPDGRSESTKGVEAENNEWLKRGFRTISQAKKGRPQMERPIIHEKTT